NLTFPIADWLFGTSDLDRGLMGHLLNGYDTRFVKKNLRGAPRRPDEAAAVPVGANCRPKPGDCHAERCQSDGLRRRADRGRGAGVLERITDPAGAVGVRHRHRHFHGGGNVGLSGSRCEKGRHQKGEVANPPSPPMTLRYRAAVLHQAHSPLEIETIAAAPIAPLDVLVRVRAAGLCHTDLEVIDGSLRYPMPIVLGHEAAGVIEDVGSAVRHLKTGDHVVLSWNPHCGHCYCCDRGLPILCEEYLAKGPQALQFDGTCKARR